MRKRKQSSRWARIRDAVTFGRQRSRRNLLAFQRRSLHLEPLEERQMLTVLTWDPDATSDAHYGGTGNWATTDAWQDSSGNRYTWDSNRSGDTAVFQGDYGTVTLDTSISAAALTFSTASYTLSSNTLTLTGTGTTIAAGQSATINSSIVLAAGQTWSADSGATLAVGGSVALGGYQLTVQGSGNASLGGVIANGSLAKSGDGTLTLTAGNTFAGGTTLNAGTLALSGGTDRLATGGAITVLGGVLDLGGYQQSASGAVSFQGGTVQNGTISKSGTAYDAQAGTVSAILAGTAGLSKTGAGTLTLSNSNSYSGGTTVSAGTLSLSGGTNRLLNTGAITVLGGVLDLGGYQQSTSGAVSFQGGTVQNGTVYKTGAAYDAQAGTVGADLQGTVGLTKTTAATFTLSGTNSYSGTTTVSAGTLQIGAGGATGTLGSGSVSISSATAVLNFNRSDTVTVSNVISGPGKVFQSGSGTLCLTATNTYTGDTGIWGTLAFANGALGSGGGIIFVNGTLQWAAGNTQDVSSRLVDWFGCAGTLDTNGNDVTLASGFTGNGGTLIKAGSGTLISTATNTSLTAITVSGGTLQFGSGGTAGTLGGASVSIASGATLAFNHSNSVSVSTVISGAGSLTHSGTGTLTLSANNQYTGGTAISAGTVAFAQWGLGHEGTITLGGVFSNATLQWAAGNTNDISGRLGFGFIVNGTLDVGSNTVTLGSPLNGYASVIKASTGKLVLTADNGYLYDTTVSGGILQVGAGGTTGTLGGGNVSVGIGGTLIFNRSNDITVNGVISGYGNVRQEGAGTLVLAANNNYSGTITVSTGRLQVGAGGATGALGSGSVSLVSGTTLAFNRSGSVTISNAIGGAGSLVQNGSGTIVLTGSNSYTGGTTINGGTLAFASGGLGTTGSVTFAGSGTLQWSGTTTDLSGRLVLSDGVTATLDTGSANVAFASSFGGDTSAAVVKVGSGSWTLSGTNTYRGGTTIHAGTVVFAYGGLGSQGDIEVAGDSTLKWASGNTRDISDRLVLGSGVTATLDTNGNNVSFGTGLAGSTAAIVKAGSGNLTFGAANSHTGGTTINAGTVAFVSGGLGPSGTITLGNAILQWTDQNTDDISGRLAIAAWTTGTLSVGSNNTVTLASGIGGSGSLAKSGGGTLILANNCSYLGSTTINVGTLQIGNGGSTGTLGGMGVSIASGATLAFNRSNTYTVTNAIGGLGSLTQNGSGTLALTGDNSYTGGTTVNGGTLAFVSGALGPSGNITFAGSGTLQWSGTNTDLSGRLVLSDAVTATLDTGGANVAFASSFGGDTSAAVVKVGSGSWTLNGTNTYTGGTTINAGTVSFVDGGLGTTGTISLAGSSTLQWGSGNTRDVSGRLVLGSGVTATLDTNGNNVSFAAGIGSTTAAIVKIGAGTLAFGSANDYTGGTTINAGTVSFVNGGLGSSGAISLGYGAGTTDTLRWAEGNTQDISGRLTLGMLATAVLDTGNNTVTLASGFGGYSYLAKAGDGTLILAGNNSYSYDTTVSAGTLQIGNGWWTGTLGNGSSVSIASGATLAYNRSDSVTVSKTISGAGSFEQMGGGTLTFSTAKSYTGGTTVSNGTLLLGAGNNTLATTGAITVTDGVLNLGGTTQTTSGAVSFQGGMVSNGTLSKSGADYDGQAGTVSAGLQGTAGLTKTGSGTLTLAGTNTYSGTTTVDEGDLRISGAATATAITVNTYGTLSGTGTAGAVTVSDGTVTPGADGVGTLNTGSLSLSSSSAYNAELSESGADQINVVGTVSLGSASLNVTSTRGYHYDTVLVLLKNDSTDAVSGTFSDLSEGTQISVNGVYYNITYVYNAETGQPGTGNDAALITSPQYVKIEASDDSGAEIAAGETADPAQFVVTRYQNADTDYALTVYYTIGGTADNGSDYTTLSGSVTIPIGETTAAIDIEVTNDSQRESAETVELTLTGTGYTIGTPSNDSVTIADNDQWVVSIEATDAAAAEPRTAVSADLGTFTVTRSGETDLTYALTVPYTISGTADNGDDYQSLSGTAVIPVGETSVEVVITPLEDTEGEGDETVTLALDTSSSYTIGTPSSDTVTIADDPSDLDFDADHMFGEVGEVTFSQTSSSTWQTISLRGTYVAPVVIAQPCSCNDSDPATVRIRNVTSTSFQMQIDEWDYQDGEHDEETVSYLVVEEGFHIMEDGTWLQAGLLDVNQKWRTENFPIEFSTTPVILSQVQTCEDTAAVAARQSNATSASFDVRLQEEEAADGMHDVESVGYVAMDAAVAQNVGIRFESGHTGTSVTHSAYTLDFTQDFRITPFWFGSVATENDTDPAALRWSDRSDESIDVRAQEEQSVAQSDTTHGAEVVDYLAFEFAGWLWQQDNQPPAVADQQFDIDENEPDETLVDTIVATDANPTDLLTYTITAGNEAGVFAIDSATGAITVADGSQLDYETEDTYVLSVEVTDHGGLSDTATITISVNDVNETPSLEDQAFNIAENSANSTTVGTVVFADPDLGQSVTLSIVSGNEDETFALDPDTGEITVADSTSLNYEALSLYDLVVRATDDEDPTLSRTATITIHVGDVNEPPGVLDQTFSLPENTPTGAEVGRVVVSFLDAGETASFQILSGNQAGVFALDSSTGLITVADGPALDYETGPTSYELTVRVSDGGAYSTDATITINVANVNEAPQIEDQVFHVDENEEVGALIDTVVADDDDVGDTLRYSIAAGNYGIAGPGVFAIDPETGALSVADPGQLNHEVAESYQLVVEVTDSGTGHLRSHALVTIDVDDVNEAPLLGNRDVNVGESALDGTLVTTAVAQDPDAGDTVTYSITDGNQSGAFSINSTTGEIRVADKTELDGVSSFTLTVEAEDDGELTDTGTFTVHVLDGAPATLTLEATIRDFHSKDYATYGHPDFEMDFTQYLKQTGLVSSQLGIDGKPDFVRSRDSEENPVCITSAETFEQWYNDVPDINVSTTYDVVFTQDPQVPTRYVFSDETFFPIDGQLFGNEGLNHNFHFTLELHATFTYRPGEEFHVAKADDDLWIYINNQLVVDIGGVHEWKEATYDLDNAGLEAGKTYSFDLFYAERHTIASHFVVDTNIEDLKPVTSGYQIVEGDQFRVDDESVTDEPMTFLVPENPGALAFSYDDLQFDTTDTTSINDALELALVDQYGNSLVPTIGTGRNAFFNMTEGQTTAMARGVGMLDANTVVVDISHLTPGTEARLIARLVNNDSDQTTAVWIPGDLRLLDDWPLPVAQDGAFQAVGGQVVAEAEHFTGYSAGSGTAIAHQWTTTADATASGGYALTTNLNNGVNTSSSTTGPRRDYAMELSDTGDYFVWVRMQGATTDDNTINLGLDGTSLATGGLSPVNTGVWEWVELPSAVNIATAGVHTLNLWMREDGVQVDKILLTTDADFTPTSLGPAESTLDPVPQLAALDPWQPKATDFDLLSDVTVGFDTDYGRTSFSEAGNVLYADLTLTSNGVYTIRGDQGPLLLAVTNISDPSVSLYQPDGVTPDGVPYYDVSRLAFTGSDAQLAEDDTVDGVELKFLNPDRVQFSYDLVVLGALNRAPQIASAPVTEIALGVLSDDGYQYSVVAVDPDGDELTYSLLDAPDGMTISAAGVITWEPGVSAEAGAYHVTVAAIDSEDAASQPQSYVLRVSDVPNRPPMFTSTPGTDAYLNAAYTYQATASDIDGDAPLYFEIVSVEDAEQNDISGQFTMSGDGLLSWTPTDTVLVETTVEVTLRVKDRPDQDPDQCSAVQVYQVLVHAEAGNHEPVILSDPPTEFDIIHVTTPQVTGGTITETTDPNLGAIHGQVWLDANADGVRGQLMDFNSWQQELTTPGAEVAMYGDYATQDGSVRNDDGSSEAIPLGFTIELFGGNYTSFYINNNGNVTFNGPLTMYTPEGFPQASNRPMIAPFWADVDTRTTFITEAYPWLPHSGVVHFATGTSSRGNPFVQVDWQDVDYYGGILFAPEQRNDFTLYIEDDPLGDIVAFVYRDMEWTTGSASGGWGGFAGDPDFGAVIGFDAGDGVHYQSYGVNFFGQIVAGGFRPFSPATLACFNNKVIAFRLDPYGNPLPLLEPGFDGFTVQLVDPNTQQVVQEQVSQTLDLNDDSVINPYTETGLYRFENVTPGTYEIRVLPQAGTIQTVPVSPSTREAVVTAGNVLTGSQYDFGEARLYEYTVEAFDPDGDTLHYELTSDLSGATIDPDTGAISGIPTTLGDYPFSVTVTDGRGGSVVQEYTLHVCDDSVNYAPQITSTPLTDGATGHNYSYTVRFFDANYDPPTFSLSEYPDGMQINSATGVISWQPDSENVGVDNWVTVVVSDPLGLSDTQRFNIRVIEAPVNRAPVFVTSPPRTAFVGSRYWYSSAVWDPEGDSWTINVASGPAGMAMYNPWGDLLWTPTDDDVGLQNVVLVARDDHGGVTYQQFTINVISPSSLWNAAPTISSTPGTSAGVDELWSYQVIAQDPNGDALTYTLDAASLALGITVSSAGLMEWTPDTTGTYHVQLTVDDHRGGVARQSFDLTVGANAPPSFGWTPQQTLVLGDSLEDEIDVLDPNEGDTVTLSLDQASQARGMVIDDGALLWTPAALGEYVVNVTAVDDHGAQSRMSYTLRVVQPGNRPPVITSVPTGPAVVDEQYIYRLAGYDPDTGQPVPFALDEGPAGSTLNLVNDQYYFTWTPSAVGTFHISLVATDAEGAQTFQQFDLPVVAEIPATGLPVIDSLPPSPARLNEVYRYQVLAHDPDNDTLSYSLAFGPEGMTLSPEGLLEFVPHEMGTFDVRIIVSNSAGEEAIQTFALPVVTGFTGNAAPQITSTPGGPATADLTYRYQVLAEDPNGDPISYWLGPDALARGATIDPDSGLLTWTPTASGTFRILVTASDGSAADTQAFDLTVLDNAPPRITSTPVQSWASDAGAYTYQVTATDPNPDDSAALEYSLSTLAAGMTLNPTTHMVTWSTPVVGLYTVTVTVTDPGGAWAVQTYELQIYDPNDNHAPTVDDAARTVIQAGQTYVHQIVASDPDGDPLTYTLESGAPTGLTLDTTGVIRWQTSTADINEPGTPHTYTVHVSDGRGGVSDSVTFSIDVILGPAPNSPPAFSSEPLAGANVGQSYTYQPIATDPDHDLLRFSLDTAPAGMTIDADTGRIDWTPTSAQLGPQAVVLRVTDSLGAWATQAFTVTVRSLNSPPRITSTPATITLEQQAYTYEITAIDDDTPLANLTFSLADAPNGMTLTDNHDGTATIQWTPGTGTASSTPYAVEFYVSDGHTSAGQCFGLVVTATPADVGLPPEITSTPQFGVAVGEDYEYQVEATDENPATLAYSRVVDVALENKVTIDPDTGVLTWDDILSGDAGTYTIKVIVTDEDGLSCWQSYSLTVAADAAPVITTSSPTQVAAGAAYRYNVVATDADLSSGDWLTFSLEDVPTELVGRLTMDQYGRIQWQTATADIDQDPYTFTIRVTDRFGKSDTEAVSLTVVADTTAPTVALSASATTINEGSQITFHVAASDNVGVTRLTLSIYDTATYQTTTYDVGLSGNITLPFSTAGTYEATATAYDAADNDGDSATLTLHVVDPTDESPVVTITSPGGGTVISTLADVIGTVDDPDGNSVIYTITLVSTASGAVTSLGTFSGEHATAESLGAAIDPTLLADGSYNLVITATDGVSTPTTVSRNVTIESDLKIGNFAIAFTDMTISVAGLSIAVVRSYDSLRSTENGDFGYGWKLEVPTTSLAVSHPFGDEYVAGTRVTITMPDGTRQSFIFQPQHQGSIIDPSYAPVFVPVPGTKTTATLAGSAAYLLSPDGGQTFLDAETAQPYNPTCLTLTTRDGVQYTIDAQTGDLLLLTDRNGNSLHFTGDGITSDSGTGVQFLYDSAGRLSQIIDPAGNRVRYTYDAAGNLVAYTDRAGKTVQYEYDQGLTHRPHFLTKITDARDIEVLKTEFDAATGQLKTLKDALDKMAGFTYRTDLGAGLHLEAVTDAAGVPTEVIRDDHGNVLRTIQGISVFDENGDPLPAEECVYQITVYTYDANDNQTAASVPFTVTGDANKYRGLSQFSSDENGTVPFDVVWATRQAFDASGNVTSSTDALGNTAHYTYNSFGQVLTTTDPLGNVSRYAYDANGNLTSTTDPSGVKTYYSYNSNGLPTAIYSGATGSPSVLVGSFAYDTNGRLVTITSATGQVSHFVYDANGNQTLRYYVWTDPNDSNNKKTIVSRTVYDREGNVTGSQQHEISGEHSFTAASQLDAYSADLTQSYSTTYNAAGQVVSSTDTLGNVSEVVYDARGLVIETRQQSAATGESSVWLLTDTVYDDNGRAVLTTDPYVSGDTIYATQTVYDDAGRVVETKYLSGVTVTISGTGYNLEATWSGGTVISSSSTEYDSAGRVTSTTDTFGNDTEYSYDAAGRTIEMRYESCATGGSTVWLISRTVYDAAGRTIATTDTYVEGTSAANITGTLYEYDASGRTICTRQVKGLNIVLSSTGILPVSSVLSAGTVISQTESVYDSQGRLSSTTDDFGTETEYTYDSLGRTIQTRRQSRDENGDLVWLVSRTAYNDLGQTAATTDAYLEGTAVEDITGTLYTYDASGRTISTDRVEGLNITITSGVSTIQSSGTVISTTETHYDALGRVEYTISVNDARTEYYYDSYGRQSAILGPEQDAAGFDDPVRFLTEYAYDAEGRQESVTTNIALLDTTTNFSTHPTLATADLDSTNAQETSYQYDAQGNMIRTTYENGSFVAKAYDDFGRVIAESCQLASGTNAVWSSQDSSFIVSGSNPVELLPTKCYEYDDFGRLIAVTLPKVYNPATQTEVHPVYEYGYDAQGRQVSIIDPLDHETRFTYNDQGQETSRTLPIGVETTGISTDFVEQKFYDEDGRLDYEVSFEGVVTSYLYDDSQGSSGRLVEKRFFDSLTAYNTDPDDPNETVAYVYDAFGRQVEVIQDADGDLETTTDQSVTDTVYSLEGQILYIVSIVSGQTDVIHYEYDAVTALHTTTWTADDLETTEEDSTTHTVYAYDSLGRLDSVTQDRRNGSAITAETTDYVFDLLGNLQQERLSNGAVSDYTYDDLNRLTSLKQFNDTDLDGFLDQGENLLAQYDYELLADGKRASVTETDDADNVTAIDWLYDDIGRLTREVYDSWNNDLDFAADYVLDLVGNRLTKKTDSDPTVQQLADYRTGTAMSSQDVDETITSTFDSNDRLLKEFKDVAGGTAGDATTLYEYGPNADPENGDGGDYTQQTRQTVWEGTDTDPQTGTKVSETTYEYNLQGQMSKTEVDSDGDGDLEERYEYKYDADGIRTSQTVTTDTDSDGSLADETPVETKYLNDKQNPTGYSQVLEERVEGVTIKTYKVGLTVISQQGSAIAGGGALYLLKDGHGSTRMLVDATGQPLSGQVFAYDAFGNRLDAATALTSLLYSGEQTDATGLQYLRARYYDPNTGGFTSFDYLYRGDLNAPRSLHKYSYCYADPVMGVDPSGREFTLASFLAFSSINMSLDVSRLTVTQPMMDAIATGLAGLLNWTEITVSRADGTGEPLVALLWGGILPVWKQQDLAGLLPWAAATLYKDALVRAWYDSAVHSLPPSTPRYMRDAFKFQARTISSPVGRGIAEYLNPMEGWAKRTGGTVNKTNALVDKFFASARKATPALVVVGATISVYEVATATDWVRQAAIEAGGWAGAVAFGWAGAQAGLMLGTAIGGPIGGAIGSIAGGMIGAVLGTGWGQQAGNNYYSYIYGD